MENLITIKIEGSKDSILFLESFVSSNSSSKEGTKKYSKILVVEQDVIVFESTEKQAEIILKKTKNMPVIITFL